MMEWIEFHRDPKNNNGYPTFKHNNHDVFVMMMMSVR